MKTITAEEFKKRYGTVGASLFTESTEKKGFVQRTKESASAGVEKIKSGLSQSGNAKGAKGLYSLGSGALKIGAGAVETAFSPLTAAVEPVVRPTIGRAVNYTADKISNVSGVQRFADSEAGRKIFKGVEDISNLNTIASAVVGPKTGQVGATKFGGAIKTSANAARTEISNAVSKGGIKLPSALAGLKNAGGMITESAQRIPSRISTNVATKQVARQAVQALPTRIAKEAARDGLDVADVKALYNIPVSQKGSLSKMATVVKDFAAGKTKTNPIEVVGKPIINRLKQLDSARVKIGSKLSSIADDLGIVTTRELFPTVFQKLRKVPGLEGLMVDNKGLLNFKNTVLASLETGADRKAIQSIFSQAVKWGSGKNKHLLRQELFEALGGKKKSLTNLTATQERAYESIRSALSDVLDIKNPAYKAANNQYRQVIAPLQAMRKVLRVAGEDADIMDLSAGLLARRITSAAASNPQIRSILRAMDRATEVPGKTMLSVEALQDFYNLLEKYYDIAPKTGFQSQVTQGIEKAVGGPLSYLAEQAKGLAGQTPAVRQAALERVLKEVFGN